MGNLKQQYESMREQIVTTDSSCAMERHKKNMAELERLGIKQSAPEPKTHRLGDKTPSIVHCGCGVMYLTD